jgi:hypothetical protein
MKTRNCVRVTRALAASIIACVALLCTPALGVAADPRDSAATDDLLARGAGYAQPQGDPQVRALQRSLRALGQRPGPIDGLFGPLTEAAVERFQRGSGLAVDGIVGPRTRRALNQQKARSVERRPRALGEQSPSDDQGRPADSRAADGGSELSGNRLPTAAGDRTQGTDESESTSIVFMTLLLALAAGGVCLAVWLGGRRRRPRAVGAGGPARPPAMPNGGAKAAEPTGVSALPWENGPTPRGGETRPPSVVHAAGAGGPPSRGRSRPTAPTGGAR